MRARSIGNGLLAGASLLAMSWAAPLYADTICTYLITSPEYGVPMDERESLRAAQTRMVPDVLAEADGLAKAGRLSESAVTYFSVLQGQDYRAGLTGQGHRCLPSDLYQGVANKLRSAASQLATQLMRQGVYEGRSGPNNGPAALRLLLMSNQYDAFERHAFEYAVRELPQRDVDPTSLAQQRLEELERMRDAGGSLGYRGLVDDLTPLLEEELAAFDTLPCFKSRLQAHLAPLYPKLADDLLAAEARHYDQAVKTDGMIPKAMQFGQATDALNSGIQRLEQHPKLTARLQQRANERGVALLEMNEYGPAQEYFEIAGNEKQAEIAGGLANSQQEAKLQEVEAAVKSDIEKMRKTDEEKAAFQDEADDMASEFGFDLED